MGSIPSCGHSGNVGVSLSKKFHSHCSSPPSCNINGYLVITGEANVKPLSMSTNGCGPGGTLGAHTITLSMVQPHLQGTSPPPGGFASTGSIVPESCPYTPSLGRRDRQAAARDFAFLFFALCVCTCVRCV